MSIYLDCELNKSATFDEGLSLNKDAFEKIINEIFSTKVIKSENLLGEKSNDSLEFKDEFKMYQTSDKEESEKSKTKFSKDFNKALSNLIVRVKQAKKDIVGIVIDFHKNKITGDITFTVFCRKLT
jgi:hypothetical protein